MVTTEAAVGLPFHKLLFNSTVSTTRVNRDRLFCCMIDYPTKSVPGGCVIGLFGVGAWALAGAAFYVIWLSKTEKYAHRHIDTTFFWTTGIVSLLIGILLVVIGLKIALKTDYRGYDPNDPDQPRMKF